MTDLTNEKLLDTLEHIILWLNTHIDENKWSSLIVNRRKPWTYRAFTNIKYGNEKRGYANLRICLHKFDVCDESESFMHPHPWPGAFVIVKGSYHMTLGSSHDRFTQPSNLSKFLMTAGSRYAISDPLVFHSVTPLEECRTIMINYEPWPADVAHTEVRTTKGKDLDNMSTDDLAAHFEPYREYARAYRRSLNLPAEPRP